MINIYDFNSWFSNFVLVMYTKKMRVLTTHKINKTNSTAGLILCSTEGRRL